jgi:hypothetical protein
MLIPLRSRQSARTASEPAQTIRREISKANTAANRIKSTWSRIKKKHEDFNTTSIGMDVTIAQLRSRDNAAWMAKNGVALNQQLDANRAKYKGKEIPNDDLVNFFPDLDKHPRVVPDRRSILVIVGGAQLER